MKKRVLSMILVLFLVVSLIPASARAADYYNAQQAVAWALNESEHLNTVNQGLVCSQYCLRCLQAGGLAIPESCGQYPNRLSTWAVEHGVGTMLPTNDSGISQMRAGDLVIVYCENHGQAYSYGIHCIFVTSIESSGFRYCANNNYFHNEYMSFAALKTYKNSFSCYTHAKANVQTFILHMQSVSPAAPAAPSVSVSGTDVTVTWNDVANETGYDAYLIQEPWGWNDVRYSVHAGPDYCHYTFTNVAPGTYAAFVISRPNSDQTQSGWTVFEVPALPAAPTVNVSPVSLYEGQSMTVSWNTVPGATSYYVRVYDPSTEVDFYGNNVGTATSQTLTFGPGKAGTYNVVVCSVNSAGGYTPSSPITVTVREGNILAQGSCGDNVTWTLDKNWTLTINGTGAIADYNQVGSLPWESYKTNIKSVVIGSGVTRIGGSDFFECSNLKSVTIPSSVTSIGNNAFDGCSSLTSVTIPAGMTSIEMFAFAYCSSLTNVTIPASLTSIGTQAFYGCSSLQDVYYSGTEAQKEAITIGNYNSPLLNANWSYIGTCGNNATWRLANGVLTISGTGEIRSGAWKKSQIQTVVIEPGVTSIGNFAFEGCSNLTSVTIPPSVTSIEHAAFFDCISLTSVTIPAGVTSIGQSAFYNCSSLTSVTIPESVTSIGIFAFGYCSSLTSVTIPASVTRIESSTFWGCSSLTSLTIPASVTSIQADAFGDCSSLTSFEVDEGNPVYTSVKGVLYNKDITELVAFPSGLTSVSIPASVTSIGNDAFVNCRKLNDVHFCGTEAQREAMTIGDANGFLTSVSWTYGHIWDAGVVMQEPTVTTEGVKKFTCTACGETKTEAIPMLGNPFTDVAAGKFYYAPVLWAISQDPQITTGVTATTFAPDRICTRAHVVTFLWRANGCPEPKLTANPFKDVPKDKYYYKAVLWAAENGITTGYADNTFRPDDECSRGQVVTFLWRAKGQPKPTSTANPFADVASGQYYTTAVLWALEQGITQGRTPTTFGPNDSCTRGHVVTFLYRAYAD